MRLVLYVWCLFLIAASPLSLASSKQNPEYQVKRLVSGLGVPWGLTQLAGGDFLITERSGRLYRYEPAAGRLSTIRGLPVVHAQGQGGLLDIALAPDTTTPNLTIHDPTLYFTYSKSIDGKAVTTLARARLVEDQLLNWQDLVVTRSQSSGGRHFGSRIAFDGAGHVFFSVGDRGERDSAQDLSTHSGSILRVRLDGSVPEDNPFVGVANALPEIWSYGHRNPQGLAYDQETRRLWAIEHGPRGGDEINLIERGKNYGWPVISYGKEYWGPVSVGEGTAKPGMEQPVKYYVPSIAPGSLLVYEGQAFPEWRGHLFSGALKLRHLNRVELNRSGRALTEERLLKDLEERIRALYQNSKGWIFFTTDTGHLYVLKPR